jgi:SNF2 family DNA or RNA helicase
MKLCPRCKKEFFVKSSSKFGKKTLLTGVCGHLVSAEKLIVLEEEILVSKELFATKYTEVVSEKILALRKGQVVKELVHPSLTVKSVDGYKLFPFQSEAVQKAEKANFNCLFEYQMGLGKTPIADTILNLHPELLNALIICKGSIVWQHFKELIRWNGGNFGEITVDPLTWTSQVIGSSSDTLFPIFKVYITSYDMVRRLDLDELKKLNLKTVILDECQKISNTKSKRSQSLRELIDELGIKHKIALSGTPIKNTPIEFYSVLNILRPDKFWSKENFEHDWVDYKIDRKTGKYKPSGIRNIEYFHEYTKDFVFRCTRDEVKEQIGLSVTEPFRDFKYIDIDKDLKKDYKRTEDEFNDFFVSHELEDKAYSFADYSHILALFSRMRHLAGLSKISWAEDFVSEWLASRVLTVEELIANEDREVKDRKLEPKLAIFTHHIDVAKFLVILH